MKTLAFTIACGNYLPKAVFLAASIRANQPATTTVLCLLERDDGDAKHARRVFDHVVLGRDIGLDGFEQLMFRYSTVEAATAIKAHLMSYLLARFRDHELIVYLDPDIWVFDDFPELREMAQNRAVIVTPHHVHDEGTEGGVRDNMLRSMQCGIFNLGFLAVRRSAEATEFLLWWHRKLVSFCYVDFSSGLFVDQKWIDMAISFFDLGVLREPGYNVANWNISGRHITRRASRYLVNSRHPLRFLHFSGIDKGKDMRIFVKYAAPDSEVHWLRRQYLEGLTALGQARARLRPWDYDRFLSGEPVAHDTRLACRRNPGLFKRFPYPFTHSNERFLAIGW